jgi:hypothetical protein
MNQTLGHATEACSTGWSGLRLPEAEPASMNLPNTLVMARRAGRRLAGCGNGRMSPTPRVGTISR